MIHVLAAVYGHLRPLHNSIYTVSQKKVQLTFDHVTESLKVGPFLTHSVDVGSICRVRARGSMQFTQKSRTSKN